ncbi:hypothetical protein E2562_022506 [Oryza meyeriana var. granulata]|uniref:Uncharacterized protein n=1 Tax=Oryza meyeriana var. granulata TaxID=110450 RepID=A0A6G1BND2_9ORYZ|nr:hypothetical protein E2562_022506 [Oryza meyeriana var. granulata]
MEDTSIAIEIDGEAICLDSVGDNEEQGAQENQEIQIIYDAESEGQVAFDNEEQGREEHSVRNGEEDQENNPAIPSREELTEELRNKIANSEEEAYRLYCDYGHRNVKQAVSTQTADKVLVDPPNQNQYYATEDMATNSSIGRPFFYQPMAQFILHQHLVVEEISEECSTIDMDGVKDAGKWKLHKGLGTIGFVVVC